MRDVLKAEKEYKPHPGTTITKKSTLAAAWGIMRSRLPHRIDWDSLANLYEWFWIRLKDYPYYNCLESGEDIVSYLKTQFSRHKRNIDSIYCIDHYARREYLTIFAPNGAFIDRGFVYLDESLFGWRRGVVHPQLPPQQMVNDETMPYFKYAIDLYRKYAMDQIPMPPAILFPDKSYFSTGF